MVEEFYLEVRHSSRAKRRRTEAGQPNAEKLSLRLYRLEDGVRKTLANLSPIPFASKREGLPQITPTDRARAWEEFSRWIVYLIITSDPAVQEGQYQNRLKAESWAHGLGEQPKEDELYDWRTDKAMLERLRPRYARVMEKLCGVVGRPRREDFDRLYPNRYEDEGLSDRARQALRDLKALFGPEILAKD
jgi:hypothetical protein